MHIRLNFKDMKEDVNLSEAVEKKLESIQNHLHDFEQKLLHLHCNIEKNPHKEEFYSIFSLYVPHAVFHARSKAKDVFTSVNSAFDKLLRQIDKRKARFKSKKKKLRRSA